MVWIASPSLSLHWFCSGFSLDITPDFDSRKRRVEYCAYCVRKLTRVLPHQLRMRKRYNFGLVCCWVVM